MGGAIGALVLEEYPHLFDCAILTSPMLKMRYKGMPELLVKFLKAYADVSGWKEIRHWSKGIYRR